MPRRTTDQDFREFERLLADEYGILVSVESAYGKPRVFTHDHKRELSDRMEPKMVAQFLYGMLKGASMMREAMIRQDMVLRYSVVKDDPDYFHAHLLDDGGNYHYEVYTDRDGNVIPEVVAGHMKDKMDAAGLVAHLKARGDIPKGARLLP